MRSEEDLIGLLIEYTILKRREECLGCMYSHGSQKRHIICLTNIFKSYFFMLGISHMKSHQIIDKEEEDFLLEFVKNHGTSDD